MLLGVLLILGAQGLFWYNRYEAKCAAAAAEKSLDTIQQHISAQGQNDEAWGSAEMPVVTIDGYDYIGYVSVPVLDLTLPVMAQWDYTRLRIAPCRQFGAVGTKDLVIAGHNYTEHFGGLHTLSPGDPVQFTDMNGRTYRYRVENVATISPYDVDVVQSGLWDLVLYTCTYGGQQRVCVGCVAE